MERMKSQKAQVSAQFAWIFILIAGAIILIFFTSIVYKQREISDTKLSETILNKLETIITGAALSPGTSQPIDMPEAEILFVCDEEGYSTMSVKRATPKEIPSQVIFAPDILKGVQITSLALPWQTPFKSTNFLYLSAPNIKYVFINPDTLTAQEILDEWRLDFIKQEVESLDDINAEGFEKIKLIFFQGEQDTLFLPESLQPKKLGVTAITITPNKVDFYKKQGEILVKDAPRGYNTLPHSDLATRFGAIFSQDLTSYECNMKKALKKLSLVSEIYAARESSLNSSIPGCKYYYINQISNLISYLDLCNLEPADCLTQLKEYTAPIQQQQDSLIRHSCPEIY
ncbi:hypothetical protein KY332_03145 [Candidatus Woesearchaeota archaeon]|nr:hypothetical protein [Candidatus Woesearchaeota archaeon]